MIIDLKQTTFVIFDGSTPRNEVAIKIGEGSFNWSKKKNIEYKLDRGILDEVMEGDQVPVDVSFDFLYQHIIGRPVPPSLVLSANAVIGATTMSHAALAARTPPGSQFVNSGVTHTVIDTGSTTTATAFTPALTVQINLSDTVAFLGNPTIEDALDGRAGTGAAAWVSTDSNVCAPRAVGIEINYEPGSCPLDDQEQVTFPTFRYESLEHDFRAGTISCSGRCNVVGPTIVRTITTP